MGSIIGFVASLIAVLVVVLSLLHILILIGYIVGTFFKSVWMLLMRASHLHKARKYEKMYQYYMQKLCVIDYRTSDPYQVSCAEHYSRRAAYFLLLSDCHKKESHIRN